MPQRVVALALAFAALASAGCRRAPVAEPGKPPAVDWVRLRERSSELLAAKKFHDLLGLEDTFGAPAAPGALRDRAAVAIDCAQARRLGKTGDAQALLLQASEALAALPLDLRDDALRRRAASELVQVHLYRRAVELLAPIAEARLTPGWREARGALLAVLGSAEPSLDGLSPGERAAAERDPTGRRLLDLLALAPGYVRGELEQAFLALGTDRETAALGELRQAREGLSTEGLETATPFAAPPALARFGLARSAAGAAANSDRKQPDLPEDDGDEEADLEALRADAGSAPLALSEEQRRHWQILVGRLQQKGGELEGAVREELASILPAASPALASIEIFPAGAGVTYATGEGGRTLAFIPLSLDDEIRQWKAEPSYEHRVSFQDVTGDGDPEVMDRYLGGSGGFLSITVTRRTDGWELLSIDQVLKGNLSFVNLDADLALEAIVSAGTQEQATGCTQCPRRFEGTVYDYRAGARRYKPIATWTSVAEWHGGASGQWGLTPSMTLGAIEGKDDSARSLLEKLRRTPREDWSKDQVEALFAALRWEARLFEDDGNIRGALRLIDDVAAVLRPAGQDPAWLLYRFRVESLKALALLTGNEPDAARAVLLQPWLIAAARSDPQMSTERAEFLGAADLNSERFDEAFEQLDYLDRTIRPKEPAVEANLAGYYSLLGNPVAARRHALQALDLAGQKEEPPAVTLPLIHLAATAARERRGAEALDWAYRALLDLKDGGDNSRAVRTLVLAASVAVDAGLPRIALALLDEALLFGEPLTWRLNGANLLFLYATALDALQQPGPAQILLRAAAFDAERTSTAVAANSYFQLSRHAARKGAEAEALATARRAFGLLVSGRRRIGVEEDKFSFLADKQEIAEWLFALLLRRRAPARELLETLEAWKLQTFLDVYRSAGATPEPPPGESLLGARIAGTLARDDVFVDLSLGAPAPFAIVVRPSGAPEAARLSCGREEIDRQVARIRKAFDLGDAASLGDIRSDRPAPELEGALADLGRCVFGRLNLGTAARRILLASDEPLFGIPWPAVRDAKGAFLDRFEIQQIPSAWVALRPRRRAVRPEGPALVVGALGEVGGKELDLTLGPGGEHPQIRHLASLGNGWNECRRVGLALKPRPLWLLLDAGTRRKHGPARTGAASPEGLLALLPRASFAHIVAHGAYNPFAPMRSALFLDSGKNGRQVLAQDLAKLDLSGLRLATLSACQTGVSGARPGSEPLGFLRALLGAGAERVLLADWSVDDRTTADLMTDFYSGLQRERASTALRRAQLAQRAHHPHPYYWAGYSLHGDWSR